MEQRFRKIYSQVTEETYLELVKYNLFNSAWDNWLEEAILEKLKKEGKL